jgi:hypothetical protein
MARRVVLRFVLPAVVGGLLGFLTLAVAMQNEPSIPAPLVSLFSPGLTVAEFLTPTRRESLRTLGPTFGGFLRVALGVNTAFYFSLLAAAAYLMDRRRSH